MDWREALSDEAEAFRKSWLTVIEHRRRMTIGYVHDQGGYWQTHRQQVAKDAKIAERLTLDLPSIVDCPKCFWITGTRCRLLSVPHPDPANFDRFKCDTCGYRVDIDIGPY